MAMRRPARAQRHADQTAGSAPGVMRLECARAVATPKVGGRAEEVIEGLEWVARSDG